MPEQRLISDSCLYARQQLAHYILERMKTGQSQRQIIAELIEGARTGTLDSDTYMMVYLAQARRTANPAVTPGTVKRWLLDHIPNPKERLKAHAMALLADHDPDEVCRMMGIKRYRLNYWKRTYQPQPNSSPPLAAPAMAEGVELA